LRRNVSRRGASWWGGIVGRCRRETRWGREGVSSEIKQAVSLIIYVVVLVGGNQRRGFRNSVHARADERLGVEFQKNTRPQ
jgi:hypothetical protein